MEYENQLALLEKDHLRYQPEAWAHVRVHWRMLCLALKHREWNEFLGQIPRILLAAPGSWLGKAPRGNVGSTKMGIFEKAE